MASLTNILLLLATISLFLESTYSQSKTYIVHMDKTAMPIAFSSHETWSHSTLSSISETPNTSKLIHTYTNAMHGFSATLTPSELKALKKSPAYLHSHLDRPIKLHTTHTPKFLGLTKSSGAWPASSYGKDVVIGVIDTGVWPESPSFNDDGMTKIPASWRGKCEVGENFNSSLCNKKLIGARLFNKGFIAFNPNITGVNNSPRDEAGHGTHCASTAAGNFVRDASYFGYARGTASGVAPRARVSVYKLGSDAVYPGLQSDFFAAVDKAIEDGVDVLSISLGLPNGDKKVLYEDTMAIATFAAMERGIFLSASAGNNGPKVGVLGNGAPWLTTVAAGTVDRRLQGELVLGNGVRFSFITLFPGKSSNPKIQIVSSQDCLAANKVSKFRNKIVICEGDTSISKKISIVKEAKVYGLVLITNLTMYAELAADSSFPKMFLTPKEGEILMNYVKGEKNKNPTGMFQFRRTTILGTKPTPKIAYYSSRGPFLSCLNFLKPDIMAPGSLILAAWPATTPTATLLSGQELHSDFNIISGTSMSTPHIAGVAALIKSVHRDWSPAAIKSAMMTTANPTDNTGSPIEDEAGPNGLDVPGFDGGAGHVVPNKAIDPGLIYDITTEDYVNFLCGLNYTAKQIQVITKSKPNKCVKRPVDLNYPSFLAYFNDVNGGDGRVVKVFTRTVTNVGKDKSVYTAKLTDVSELRMKVEPRKLVFKKKYEKLSYKLTIEGPKLLSKISDLGSLSWVEESGKYVVRSPIVATSIYLNKSLNKGNI